MTLRPTNPVLAVCFLGILVLSGCSQKKPPVVATPQAPSPAAAAPEPTPQPTPAETQPQTQASQPATQGTPPPDQQEVQSAAEKTDAAKGKPKTHAPARKTGSQAAGTAEARNKLPKTVVGSDSAESASAPGLISPSVSQAEVAQAQTTTEQLLQNAEANLNGIKRQLSQDEQAMAGQVRDFVTQSRQAIKENDLVRAHNLAVKANLLSSDLAKPR